MTYNPFLLETAASESTGTGSPLIWVAYFVIIGAVMYFMLIRPQRKRTKDEKKLRESLQVGDEIITIGGLYGRIISLKEETVVFESKSDHSKFTVARWAIQTNLTKHEADKAAEKKPAVKEKAKEKKNEEKVEGKLN